MIEVTVDQLNPNLQKVMRAVSKRIMCASNYLESNLSMLEVDEEELAEFNAAADRMMAGKGTMSDLAALVDFGNRLIAEG